MQAALGKSHPSLSREAETVPMGTSSVRSPRRAQSAAAAAPPTSGPSTATS